MDAQPKKKRCFCSNVKISIGLQNGTLLAWESFLQDAADGFRMYWPWPQISDIESGSKEPAPVTFDGELV